MNQKEYKLSIRKNKTIIQEVGPGKYATAGMDAGKTLIKTGSDALKMTGAFLKRSWGATFGYAWKIYKNIKKHGVIAGLAAANKEFISADKQIKREMQSLIKSQPGAADANLFMSMACPAAKAFDVFVDKEFTKKNMMNLLDKGGPRSERDREKYKSLYNLIMAISHITHDTSLNTYKDNEKKLSRSEKRKKKRKDYKLSDEAKKNLNTEEFWKVCIILSKFNKISKQFKKEFTELQLQKFNVTNEQMLFLDYFSKNRDIKSGLNYIKDNEVEYQINSLNKIILYDDSIECIKLILNSDIDIENLKTKEEEEPESSEEDNETQESFNVLSIKSNRIVLKEEETEEPSSDSEEGVDLKSSMSLSFASFYILRSLILTDLIKSSIKTPLILNQMTVALFDKVKSDKNLTEGFANKLNLLFEQDQKNIENESFESLDETIEKLNSRIEVFNNKFEFKIKTVDKSIIQKIKSAFLEIEKKVDESLNKVQSDLEKSKEKEISIANGIQEILDSITKALPDIDISSSIEKNISDSVSIVTDDIASLKDLSQIITSGSDQLSKLGIEISDISYITSSLDKNRSDFENLKKLEDTIKSYTNKKSELESKIEKDTEELEKENEKEENKDSNTETIEVPADQLTDKKEDK